MQQPQNLPKKRLLIFHKVSNLLRISILVSKMRKPAIPKLIFLKKTRKFKRFMLLKQNNSYGFLKDYEFSPSSNPLIRRYKKKFKNGSYKDNIYSMFFLCRRLGGMKAEEGEVVDFALPLQTLPAATIPEEYLQPLDLGYDQEESVDQRAERFIERFYQEMRMQRQESI
ncbi:hypothetical protein P3X46_031367 [Hevea brasiliensis]|uniref:Cotton fiber protein n=2 Tax=Hevea brasiliensis TaxID=3981 RepID=A0ABQ9KK43_HEVBR|nr:hypothetical protein P3X46_031367 [Hevea brasiliensis]